MIRMFGGCGAALGDIVSFNDRDGNDDPWGDRVFLYEAMERMSVVATVRYDSLADILSGPHVKPRPPVVSCIDVSRHYFILVNERVGWVEECVIRRLDA